MTIHQSFLSSSVIPFIIIFLLASGHRADLSVSWCSGRNADAFPPAHFLHSCVLCGEKDLKSGTGTQFVSSSCCKVVVLYVLPELPEIQNNYTSSTIVGAQQSRLFFLPCTLVPCTILSFMYHILECMEAINQVTTGNEKCMPMLHVPI